MLPELVISLLQKAMNGYCRLDPELFQRLAKLEQKVIAVEFKGGPGPLYIQPSADGLLFFTHYDGVVATKLMGSLFSLMDLGLQKGTKSQSRLFAKDVTISGDLEFGQAMKETLDSIEIDWEYYLAKAVGDSVAYHIGKSVKQLLAWKSEAVDTLIQNTKEYFQEESRHLPPCEEFEDFCNDVGELAMDVDRMAARLKRIE